MRHHSPMVISCLIYIHEHRSPCDYTATSYLNHNLTLRFTSTRKRIKERALWLLTLVSNMPVCKWCRSVKSRIANQRGGTMVLRSGTITHKTGKRKASKCKSNPNSDNICLSFVHVLKVTRIAERRFLTGLPRGYFFWREGAAIHTQATIKPCQQPLHATEPHVRLTLLKDFHNQKKEYHF